RHLGDADPLRADRFGIVADCGCGWLHVRPARALDRHVWHLLGGGGHSTDRRTRWRFRPPNLGSAAVSVGADNRWRSATRWEGPILLGRAAARAGRFWIAQNTGTAARRPGRPPYCGPLAGGTH